MNLFQTLTESFRFAWRALSENRLRTFLSLLGITIGIFAILAVFTVVDSLEANLRSSVKSLGQDVVFVQKWPWAFGSDYPWWKYMNRPLPSYEESVELEKRIKSAQAIAFVADGNRTVQNGNQSLENVTISAVSYDYSAVKELNIAAGRYFTETECASSKPLAIIGDEVARMLFPNSSPLNKFIKVAERKALVVGVFKREGESILGGSMDNQVVIPVQFGRTILDVRKESADPSILIKPKAGVSADELMDELRGLMRSLRKTKPLADDDFAINQTSVLNNQFDGLFGIVGMAGWIIGGFSILVGGFGIANIMFVSVRERTNLIGIQKSLGAKNLFILLQFLFESVMLAFIGGLLGLLVIVSVIFFLGDSIGLTLILSWDNVMLALTVSILIGIISGFIPAYGASQLDPVEAIRTN